ncbi:DNA-binding protein [bacterium]|nr:DNA-binding protein [bacterium]
MKQLSATESQFVLSFDRGEELFSLLLSWVSDESVRGATLTGLGAADSLEVAYYNLATKEYERHLIDEEVEILSLTGNIALLNDAPLLHIHGVFGRKDLSTFGGHLFMLRISGAGEIHLTKTNPLKRAHDMTTGLNLLCGLK